MRFCAQGVLVMIALGLSAPAQAASVVIGADDCAASANLVREPEDRTLRAVDLNPWGAAVLDGDVIIDIPLAVAPGGGYFVFERLHVDLATGEVFDDDPYLCGGAEE